MTRYLRDVLVCGLVLIAAGYLSAQQGPSTLKGNGVTGVWSADQLCVSSTTKDSYIAEVGANDPGIYTNGTNCAAGTLRFDITSTTATYATSIQQVVQIGSTDSTTSTFYAHDIDSTLAAGAGNNTASLNGVIRGILRGANLTSTRVEQSAVHGVFFITGTDSSTWPKAGVIGEVHDNTTVADAAVMAVLGGDSNATTATAAFATRNLNSAGTSQFTYGLDFGSSITGFQSATQTIKTADIRFSNGNLAIATSAGIQFNSAIGVATPAVTSAVTLASGYNLVLAGTGSISSANAIGLGVVASATAQTIVGAVGLDLSTTTLKIRNTAFNADAAITAAAGTFSGAVQSSGTFQTPVATNMTLSIGGTSFWVINSSNGNINGNNGTTITITNNAAMNVTAAGAMIFGPTNSSTLSWQINGSNVWQLTTGGHLVDQATTHGLSVANTATPSAGQVVVGTNTTQSGTVLLANGAGGGNTWTLASGATSAWTLTGKATAPAQGDLFTFSNATGQMASVVDVATGSVLVSGGVGAVPTYSTSPTVTTINATNVNATGAYQFNGNAFASGTVGPSAPTGTASTTLVMAGLAGSITTRTGKIMLCMSGYLTDNTANDGTKAQMSYGTGTAPVNGAALTGTQIGPVQQYNASTLAASASAPYGACTIVTGLTINTAYWFDTAFAAITGGTGSIVQAYMSANDQP